MRELPTMLMDCLGMLAATSLKLDICRHMNVTKTGPCIAQRGHLGVQADMIAWSDL